MTVPYRELTPFGKLMRGIGVGMLVLVGLPIGYVLNALWKVREAWRYMTVLGYPHRMSGDYFGQGKAEAPKRPGSE